MAVGDGGGRWRWAMAVGDGGAADCGAAARVRPTLEADATSVNLAPLASTAALRVAPLAATESLSACRATGRVCFHIRRQPGMCERTDLHVALEGMRKVVADLELAYIRSRRRRDSPTERHTGQKLLLRLEIVRCRQLRRVAAHHDRLPSHSGMVRANRMCAEAGIWSPCPTRP
eukprot:5430669-Prymnesium_polylepis.1